MLYTRISLLRNITFGEIPKPNPNPQIVPHLNVTKTNEISTIPKLSVANARKPREISQFPKLVFENVLETNGVSTIPKFSFEHAQWKTT